MERTGAMLGQFRCIYSTVFGNYSVSVSPTVADTEDVCDETGMGKYFLRRTKADV
jgi:hypothetical protein